MTIMESERTGASGAVGRRFAFLEETAGRIAEYARLLDAGETDPVVDGVPISQYPVGAWATLGGTRIVMIAGGAQRHVRVAAERGGRARLEAAWDGGRAILEGPAYGVFLGRFVDEEDSRGD